MDLKLSIAKIQHAFRHPGFRKYFFNTGWLMAEKVLRLFVGLLVGVYVARYLGPERFGLLNYAVSFAGLFSALATLGLDSIVVRNLVQHIEDRDKILGTAFVLKLIGAFLLIGIVALAIQLTSSDNYTKILIFIITGGVVFDSLKVIDFYFQSQVLGRFSSIAGIYAFCAIALLQILLVYFKASLVWFAVAQFFSTAIFAAALSFLYIRNCSIFKWNFDLYTAKELLIDSWPLILSGLVVMVYMRIDQIMIKEMLNNEAVGNYSAAVKISEAWYFIPTVIANSLFPAILSARKISEQLYYERLQKLYNLVVLISIGIAIPTTFLSNWLILSLYGENYSAAAPVLSINIWCGIFVSLGISSGKWFLVEKMQILMFIRTFYGMIVNIILNIILIPKYEIVGAAIATLIAQFIAAYFSDLFNKRTATMFFMKTRCVLFFIHMAKKR